MKPLPLIHTSWLKPFAEFFEQRSISLSRYYDAAQIEPALITSGDGWITKVQLYSFLNSISEGESMPEIGFVVGETITPDKLGGLGQSMSEAEKLSDGIQAFCFLINRHVEENRCWLDEAGDGEVWFLNSKTASFAADRAIADHAGLMSMVNIVRLVGGPDWYPGRMMFQTPPTNAHRRIAGLADTRIKFDQPAAGFTFPATWLLESIHVRKQTGEPTSKALLRGDEAPVEKLRRLIDEIVGVGGIGPSIKLMAELCGTSPRTLHRRLSESGTTYQRLLDEVRFERACSRLRDPDTLVKELAFELGYSGSNNFIRAFRRLSGQTPEQFRKSASPTR